MSPVAAVIPAYNEAPTVGRLVSVCRQAGLDPVLVVANGCTDQTEAVARAAGAEVLAHPVPVGHDVGRALGAAALPEAEGVVFLDADLPLSPRELRPFAVAVTTGGTDVALNRIDALVGPAHLRHPVLTGSRFLNLALGRTDLGHSTLTAVPHALSRRALDRLGPSVLAVPPLAHAQAVLAGLEVAAVHPVEVLRRNRRRLRRPGVVRSGADPLADLILGDQLEALTLVLSQLGPRGGRTDLARRRDLLPATTPLSPARPEDGWPQWPLWAPGPEGPPGVTEHG